MFRKFFRPIIIFIPLFAVSCGSDERPAPVPRKPIPAPSPKLPAPKPVPPKEPSPPAVNYCVKPNQSFKQNGIYRFKRSKVRNIVVYKPITNSDCKMPIMTNCNGTGASQLFYREVLERFATHGYFVAAYETPQSGSGKEALTAVEYAMREENTDDNLVATIGHSQGGQCSASVTYELERKYPNILVASIHGEPAYGMSRPDYTRIVPQIKSPVFVISGSRDTVVPRSWVSRGWKLLKTEDRFWYEAQGATHMNPQAWFAAGGLAFSNMVLFDYDDAREVFLNRMPASREWRVIYD